MKKLTLEKSSSGKQMEDLRKGEGGLKSQMIAQLSLSTSTKQKNSTVDVPAQEQSFNNN